MDATRFFTNQHGAAAWCDRAAIDLPQANVHRLLGDPGLVADPAAQVNGLGARPVLGAQLAQAREDTLLTMTSGLPYRVIFDKVLPSTTAIWINQYWEGSHHG